MIYSVIKEILVAFAVGIRNIFKKRMTLRYPEVKLDIDSGYTYDFKTDTASPGFKGRHILYTDKCTGCSLCAIVCENIADCIDMVRVEGNCQLMKEVLCLKLIMADVFFVVFV